MQLVTVGIEHVQDAGPFREVVGAVTVHEGAPNHSFQRRVRRVNIGKGVFAACCVVAHEDIELAVLPALVLVKSATRFGRSVRQNVVVRTLDKRLDVFAGADGGCRDVFLTAVRAVKCWPWLVLRGLRA